MRITVHGLLFLRPQPAAKLVLDKLTRVCYSLLIVRLAIATRENTTMSYLPEKFYSTDRIKRHSEGHTHYFDASTMRFFNSRIGSNAYPTTNPFVALFTTSEQFTASTGWTPGRKYSVRSYDSRSYDFSTVGEFQAYTTSASANRAAKQLAGEWEYTLEDQHEYALLINQDYDYEARRASLYGDAYRLNNWKRNVGVNLPVKPEQIKSVRVDNTGQYADRWTIYGEDFMIGSSDNPTHPMGVWAYQDVNNWKNWNKELGEPSAWDNLPITLQHVLINFFRTEEPTNA